MFTKSISFNILTVIIIKGTQLKDGQCTENFSIHDLIMTIRVMNNLTQTQFAKRLSIVQSTISKIEAKKIPDIPFRLVCSVSQEFNIPIESFQKQLLKQSDFKNKIHYPSILKPYYDDHDLFRSKTIKILLDTICEITKEDIYDYLKLKRSLLMIDDIHFNINILDKIEQKYSKSDFDQFIDSALHSHLSPVRDSIKPVDYKNKNFTSVVFKEYISYKYIENDHPRTNLLHFLLNTLYLELCLLNGNRLERDNQSNEQLKVKI